MTDQQPVAVLRVFDIQEEDGTVRRYDAHAVAGALQLEPGDYELVRRPTYWCNKCGYGGPVQVGHQRPNGSGECNYMAALLQDSPPPK